MSHLKKFPAVTIAKVNGWCFGGGMEVVGLCDIAIVAEESIWGYRKSTLHSRWRHDLDGCQQYAFAQAGALLPAHR